MKSVLRVTKKTQEYLDGLPKIYLVGCWARFAVREFPFTEKFEKDPQTGEMIPLVYCYDDFNGQCPRYHLVKITQVTSAYIVMWTQRRNVADKIAAMYNKNMV